MSEKKVPLWKYIRDVLADEIRQGIILSGELLPTEKHFSKRFNVHRHTIRRAMQELREIGLIRTDQGRGSVVLEQPYEYQMGHRTRFSENMSLNSLKARSYFIYGDVISASDVVSQKLEIPVRSKVSYIEMYGEADGKRVFVASQYMPYTDMENLILNFKETGSMTSAYARYGISDYFRKISRISTRISNAEETTLLGLTQKQPLLVVEYINVDKHNHPLEFGITRFCGDRMEIVVNGSGSD